MNHLPGSREKVALRVLAGRESAEQAALRLGVSTAEILRWCDLVRYGSALAQTRSQGGWRTAALGGFALLLVASTWARVALGGPCTTGSWPAAGMSGFCPETPALAGPINTNFAYLASSLKTKFNSSNLNNAPGAWVGAANINPNSIKSNHLNANIFAWIHLTDGSIPNGDFASATIQPDKLKTTKLYLSNLACRKDKFFDTLTICVPAKASGSCSSGQSKYYVCGSNTNTTGCLAAPPAACTNTLVGGHL